LSIAVVLQQDIAQGTCRRRSVPRSTKNSYLQLVPGRLEGVRGYAACRPFWF